MKTNYHNHCYLDDGNGELFEHADSAIKNGLTGLGFSCHAPLPFINEWTLTTKTLPTYLEGVKKLKSEYKERLDIALGLEVDYIPGKMGPSSQWIKDLKLDYVIGSVHMLEDPATGTYYDVDGPDEGFLHLLKNVYKNDIKKMVAAYFHAEISLMEEHEFDILGHCDLIKKKNKDNKFFDQNEAWYRKEALGMLEVLAGKDIIMEINTGAIARGYQTEFYPNLWMLKEAFRMNIPITLNSDCHQPEKISESYTESMTIIKDIGYRELQILIDGKWLGKGI
ncbi:MAG: histidinol-phosphatase [Spirochaetales bacterium]|nr:histidinol-phosphatase [Spirochaetales bacterium]